MRSRGRGVLIGQLSASELSDVQEFCLNGSLPADIDRSLEQIPRGEIFITVTPIVLDLEGIAAVDNSGTTAGTVKIPYEDHGFTAGDTVTIAGSTNYNAAEVLHATTDADNLIITAAYAAETFAEGVTATGTPTAVVSLSAEQVSCTQINNYGQAALLTLQLPTAAANMSFVAMISATGHAFHIKADANDKHYLDGTGLDDADKVSLASPAVGNCASFFTFKTGASTYDWYCNTIAGLWTDGGA